MNAPAEIFKSDPGSTPREYSPGPVEPGRERDTSSPKRFRLGLALSSGGAKGLAHIGVIQVLEENGIEVDCGGRLQHGRLRGRNLGLRV